MMRDVFPRAGERPEPAPQGDASAGLGLRDLLLALRRHRWLIALGTLLGWAAATALALRSEPLYTASASIVLEPQAAVIADLAPAAPGPCSTRPWSTPSSTSSAPRSTWRG
jgi:uncharacterized protein involved in exopolysaccharide biosynthesis